MRQNIVEKYTVDKFALAYEKISERMLCGYRRAKLSNKDFSIISNNCWGGHVYRHFGLPYTSPTVGLYFFAEEYINFLSDIKNNLSSSLSFINPIESKYYAELKRRKQLNVPIGVLNNDIEIVFLHYKTQAEAKDKWKRRCERVNFNNLIVKNSEMNLCKLEHLISFDNMPFEKKVLLVSREYEQLTDYNVVRRYTNDVEIVNDTTYYSSVINLIDLINR